jgi:hypothetical protein
MLSWQLPASRPADVARHLVRAGLISAFVVALASDVQQIEGSKECRGAFSTGFSNGFDLLRCDLVLRKTGNELIRVPLPR